jgi:flavin reductase (DIM6/NTAB) family NADH-FMN oxidoreductase RutF
MGAADMTSEETVGFDPDKLAKPDQYKLLAGSIMPRPIALVCTIGSQGVNAAPFSFFNAIGADPPMVVFSAGLRSTGSKDTMRNIAENGEFVVHIIDEAAAPMMNICAIDYGPGVDETVAMECRVMEHLKIGRQPYDLIVGEVVYFHFRAGLVNDRFHVDAAKLAPLGRMSGMGGYVRTTDRFEMARLPVPPGKPAAK